MGHPLIRREVADLKSIALYKAALAEVVGTFILVFAGCSVCLDKWQNESAKEGVTTPSTVQISLAFGIAVATAVWCIAHVSGGHINPAVTAGMLATFKISFVRGVLYILAQCLGAVGGAALVYGIQPPYHHKELGATMISDGVTLAQAFGTEFCITFILVFTVFASCDKRRTDLGGSIPLTIGLSVTLCHLFAIKYTGSSMNPARSFGPALVTGNFKDHWVYWIAPCAGGIIAAFLYELLFAVDASKSKLINMVTLRDAEASSQQGGVDSTSKHIVTSKV